MPFDGAFSLARCTCQLQRYVAVPFFTISDLWSNSLLLKGAGLDCAEELFLATILSQKTICPGFVRSV